MLIAVAPLLASGQDVSRQYVSAQELFEDGNYEEAIGALDEVIAARPEPGGRLRRGGAMLVDYTPYVMLAIAHRETGDCRATLRTLTRADGYNAMLGRAGDLGGRLVGARRICRDEIVSAARETLAQPSRDQIGTLASHVNVAPVWAGFERVLVSLDQESAALEGQLEQYAEGSPLNMDGIDGLVAEADSLSTRYSELLGQVRQASTTPPPAPEDADDVPSENVAPASDVALSSPTEMADPTAAAESNDVAGSALELTPAQPERRTPASPPAEPETSSETAAALPTPLAEAGPDPNPDLQLRIELAKTAFFSRGDLAGVLDATDQVSPTGNDELRWQLFVLRAAAQFYAQRLGELQNGHEEAGRTIRQAIETLPEARPASAHFAPAFVEMFSRLAGQG